MAGTDLGSFGDGINVAVVGAAGGLGAAFAALLDDCPGVANVVRLSRRAGATERSPAHLHLDLDDDRSIVHAASRIANAHGDLHLVIVATGLLHGPDGMQPEKSWRHLTPDALETAFRVNAVGPALVAKSFLPLLARNRKTAFAALSARVGSIEDNALGGWYAYRTSKAALNMLIRTLAVELERARPQALCVGLHPGTVSTRLSGPFLGNVPREKLFSPAHSAGRLLSVLDRLSPEHSGRVFAWDAKPVPF